MPHSIAPLHYQFLVMKERGLGGRGEEGRGREGVCVESSSPISCLSPQQGQLSTLELITVSEYIDDTIKSALSSSPQHPTTVHIHVHIEGLCLTSQLKYVRLFPDNTAILGGKKIARFYTISEMQAARNLYFQYVNYQ